ncbi:DEKNAAC103614 [Brettanomyces naardenensis]|uniref:DEKNAAC103614 n=1 Tax=Brettanomyces naardenensis TaxID=13370 RepID=A0A448YNM9_BRENA|nr:DEKNAAC103614 [Brettanomyces naardenensis]
MFSCLFLLLTCVSSFSLSPESNYYLTLQKPNDDHTVATLAELSFISGDWVINSTLTPTEGISGEYCLSLSRDTPTNIDLSCFNFEKLQVFPVTGALTLQKSAGDHSFSSISFLQTPKTPSDRGTTTKDGGLKLIIRKVQQIPDPVVGELNVPDKVGESTHKEKGEKQEKEEEKTFIEKYWMYIIPGVLVLLMGQQ